MSEVKEICYMGKIIFRIKQCLLPAVGGEEAQHNLTDDVIEGRPLMVARFGAVEIKAVLYKLFPLLSPLLKAYTYRHIGNNAGFFPVEENLLKRYAVLMKEDMKQLDVLASWRIEEFLFRNILRGCKKIRLGELGPNFTKFSWSQSLKGKKVLVIHPFAKTIKSQYEKNRSKLFGEYSDYILPEFASLQVIPAVQTIAGNRAGFETWFEALEYMEREIDECDFDVALIGCGAYGFPLAAYCKKIGKQGIHIGGPLQLYFGIKGKRWDNYGFYNEYWVNPDESEKPKNLEKVEGGCYW